MKTITAIVCILLAGCAATVTPDDQFSPILIETSRSVWIRPYEIGRYSCLNPEATFACENQGSRVLQQRCTCRFY